MISILPQHPQPHDILIVEDDALQREVLAAALSSHGYEVRMVSNGLDAIRAVRERGCDIMLVDYSMPEINGLMTALLVRDIMGMTACPAIIALTASPDDVRDRQGVFGDGFDGIIAKPVRLSDLLNAIESCLKVVPNRESRRASQAALFERNWAEYDASPDRPDREGLQLLAPRILVVEDDNLQQTVLKSILQSQGYDVETATDGAEAVRAIRTGSYDLVLMDYRLPGIDGLASARLVFDLMNDLHRPRMIALTAARGSLVEALTQIGSIFDEIVEKSEDLGELLAGVVRQLRLAPNPVTRHAVNVICSPTAKVQ